MVKLPPYFLILKTTLIKSTTIRRIKIITKEMFNKLLDEARAGENVGVLLRGIDKKDVERGIEQY